MLLFASILATPPAAAEASYDEFRLTKPYQSGPIRQDGIALTSADFATGNFTLVVGGDGRATATFISTYQLAQPAWTIQLGFRTSLTDYLARAVRVGTCFEWCGLSFLLTIQLIATHDACSGCTASNLAYGYSSLPHPRDYWVNTTMAYPNVSQKMPPGRIVVKMTIDLIGVGIPVRSNVNCAQTQGCFEEQIQCFAEYGDDRCLSTLPTWALFCLTSCPILTATAVAARGVVQEVRGTVYHEGPDLKITRIRWSPTTVYSGLPATFFADVTNSGSRDSGPFNARLNVWHYEGFDWDLGTTRILNLRPGETTTVNGTGLAGSGWVYGIEAFVDEAKEVRELFENNNYDYRIFFTEFRPADVAVDAIEWSPADPVEGETVQFNATVRNWGDFDASNFQVGFLLDDQILASPVVTSLADGKSTIVTVEAALPRGSHALQVVADYTNVLKEWDETDNVRVATISVAPGPNAAPSADFAHSCDGLECVFDASLSYDPETANADLEYGWDFGDGGTATGLNANHAYPADGTYSVILTVTDPEGAQDTAERSLAVARPNTPPSAADDAYETPFGQALSVPAPGVLANDADAEADPLSARLVSPPSQGSLSLGLDGSFQYTPSEGFSGTDSFTYVANDGRADSAPATAAITVLPPPPRYGVDLDPAAQSGSVAPRGSITYRITVTNTGNVADTIRLTKTADSGGWKGVLSAASVTLEPGASAIVELKVTAPQKKGSFTVTVTGTSAGDDQVADSSSARTTSA